MAAPFLDEVGEIPLEMRSKLLRVLQEGEYERVGEENHRKVNVRIIAGTNRKLAQEVEARRFRQDLDYRLNVFPIEVAPLRNRKKTSPYWPACLWPATGKNSIERDGNNPGRSGETAKLSLARQRAGITEHHRTGRELLLDADRSNSTCPFPKPTEHHLKLRSRKMEITQAKS